MMDRPYIEEKAFERIDFSEKPLAEADYDSCTFTGCNFLNSDLSGTRFIDCEFRECNLSTANLTKTSFQDTRFRDCKMLGLYFQKCNPLGFMIGVENCQLDHSSFYKVNLILTTFLNSKLHDVDFTEAELKNAVFDNCDLLNSVFENTHLEKADFSTSFNYSIDPEINRIKGAKFSLPAVVGLLNKYGIEIKDDR